MLGRCLGCGGGFEYTGREFVSRYEIVRRYECAGCGTPTFEVVRKVDEDS